jgi:hypothetical protein
MFRNYCPQKFDYNDDKVYNLIDKVLGNKIVNKGIITLLNIISSLAGLGDVVSSVVVDIMKILELDNKSYLKFAKIFRSLLRVTNYSTKTIITIEKRVKEINPDSSFFNELRTLRFDGDFDAFEKRCDKIFDKETYNYLAGDFAKLFCILGDMAGEYVAKQITATNLYDFTNPPAADQSQKINEKLDEMFDHNEKAIWEVQRDDIKKQSKDKYILKQDHKKDISKEGVKAINDISETQFNREKKIKQYYTEIYKNFIQTVNEFIKRFNEKMVIKYTTESIVAFANYANNGTPSYFSDILQDMSITSYDKIIATIFDSKLQMSMDVSLKNYAFYEDFQKGKYNMLIVTIMKQILTIKISTVLMIHIIKKQKTSKYEKYRNYILRLEPTNDPFIIDYRTQFVNKVEEFQEGFPVKILNLNNININNIQRPKKLGFLSQKEFVDKIHETPEYATYFDDLTKLKATTVDKYRDKQLEKERRIKKKIVGSSFRFTGEYGYTGIKMMIQLIPTKIKRKILSPQYLNDVFDEFLKIVGGLLLGADFLVDKQKILKKDKQNIYDMDDEEEYDEPFINEFLEQNQLIDNIPKKFKKQELDFNIFKSNIDVKDIEKYKIKEIEDKRDAFKKKTDDMNKFKVETKDHKTKIVDIIVKNKNQIENIDKTDTTTLTGLYSNKIFENNGGSKLKNSIYKSLCKLSSSSMMISSKFNDIISIDIALLYIISKTQVIARTFYNNWDKKSSQSFCEFVDNI